MSHLIRFDDCPIFGEGNFRVLKCKINLVCNKIITQFSLAEIMACKRSSQENQQLGKSLTSNQKQYFRRTIVDMFKHSDMKNLLPEPKQLKKYQIHHVWIKNMGGTNAFVNLVLCDPHLHSTIHDVFMAPQLEDMKVGERRKIIIPFKFGHLWVLGR